MAQIAAPMSVPKDRVKGWAAPQHLPAHAKIGTEGGLCWAGAYHLPALMRSWSGSGLVRELGELFC